MDEMTTIGFDKRVKQHCAPVWLLPDRTAPFPVANFVFASGKGQPPLFCGSCRHILLPGDEHEKTRQSQ
jgi:hypothetical protein